MTSREPARVAGAQTLLRALDILDCFVADGPSLILTEISRSLDLTPPTTHRLLKALVSRGMLVYDGERYYSLGPAVMRLATAMLHRTDDLVRICTPTLERLREQTGETIALYSVVGNERLCVAELVSLQPIRMESGIGRIYPLDIGAAGKVLLAWRPELLTHTVTTPRRRKELEQELPIVLGNGYAISMGEVVPGAASVAVPILDTSGVVVAALGVSGPAERWTQSKIVKNVPTILRETTRLSERLGSFRTPTHLGTDSRRTGVRRDNTTVGVLK
jgi:IclR family transcriptional regulator, KDG regulon repressor